MAEKQTRAVSVAITARLAIRVLPLLAGEFAESKLNLERVADDIVLPIFRAAAVAWAGGRYLDQDMGINALYAAEAAFIASDAASNAVARDATAAAEAAARVAAHADRAAVAEAAFAAYYAADAARGAAIVAFYADATNADAYSWDTAEADAEIAADAAARLAYDELWNAVSADATRLEGADAIQPDELANEPIWSMGVPRFVWDFERVFF